MQHGKESDAPEVFLLLREGVPGEKGENDPRLASPLNPAAAAVFAVDDGRNRGQSTEFDEEAAKFGPFFQVNFRKFEGQSLRARSADNDLRANRAKTMIDLQMEQRSRSRMAVAGRQAAAEV